MRAMTAQTVTAYTLHNWSLIPDRDLSPHYKIQINSRIPGALSLWVKQPQHEADLLSQFPYPLHAFTSCCLGIHASTCILQSEEDNAKWTRTTQYPWTNCAKFTSSQRTLCLRIGSCHCQKPCFDPEDRILHLGHKWGNQEDGLPTGTPLPLLVPCGSCLSLFWFSILSSLAWHMPPQAERIKMCSISHYTTMNLWVLMYDASSHSSGYSHPSWGITVWLTLTGLLNVIF